MNFSDYAYSIGAIDRIALLEEPFAEDTDIYVDDIPVRVAADETVHSDIDVLKRIELGYTAIALKPIAKTLSMSFKMVKLAHDHDVPCYYADLKVNSVKIIKKGGI